MKPERIKDFIETGNSQFGNIVFQLNFLDEEDKNVIINFLNTVYNWEIGTVKTVIFSKDHWEEFSNFIDATYGYDSFINKYKEKATNIAIRERVEELLRRHEEQLSSWKSWVNGEEW